MGVPAFFRWLSRKYPSIVVHCVEQSEQSIDGVNIPINSSEPNPNGVEFDNLYLDMNGIIHPCCHPENKPAPKNEDEMMVAIFEYIDRLFRIIRPRRLLYMAIDGVAPRAKMNQQRSRRFRASKETSDKITEISTIRQRLLDIGAHLPPEKETGEHFDSNCITPGTPFMDRLSICLHYYIHDRLNSDPGWKNIEVILSDANVPGEGEHKIMDYIRKQRGSPSYDPNTKHCLCGADADLIMLGLATHEPNFTIIREEFVPNQPRPCELCGQQGHELKDCMGLAKEMGGDHDELPLPTGSEVSFIFIRLNVLREYLTRELNMQNLPFTHDIERAIDDWVFMCFFVGNDFLPHLPSLEIREGAIDRLVTLYKSTVYKTGGYLTENGIVNMQRVQMILNDLGQMEDEIFKRRQENELSFRRRAKERNKRKRNEGPAWTPTGQFAPTRITDKPRPVQDARKEAYIMRLQGMLSPENDKDNKNAAENIRKSLHSGNDSAELDSPSPQQQSKGIKRKRDRSESDSEEEPHDEVRLWEDGWKDRYYASKFEISSEDVEFRFKVAAAYAKGLCWVLQYYYQGCPSWKWFFPYHYAPFASDFVNIADIPTSFEKGTKPFKPMEQLMGVFPAASRQHLPESWGELMTSSDSPIIDFYPINFKVDLNGKRYAWQGVALLPFVDERRLLKGLKEVYPLLSKEEKRRNTKGHDRLYVSSSHTSYKYFISFYEGEKDYKTEYLLDPTLIDGMSGTLLLAKDAIEPGGVIPSPVRGCEDLNDNCTVCVRFQDPKYDADHIFLSKRLPGAVDPENVLKPLGLGYEESRNWRPVIGMSRSNQQASLGNPGRRMLNHSMHHAGAYNSIAGQNQYSNYDRAMMARGGDVHRGNNTNNYQHRQQQQQQYQDYGRGGNGGQYQGWQRQSTDQRYNQTPYSYDQQGGSSWQQGGSNRRQGPRARNQQRYPPYGMDDRSGRGGGGGGFNYGSHNSRPHFQF